ncbi:ATP-binding cassette domain-containing protein [Clostridiaceae bacterium M8S5]|nr:ATP-binding cassette domain-containing protein [Clostridiaceae bacterium M8S5]
MNNIIIEGAHINNLKGINITIPKNKITVITGVSGSGKSSLAFNIVFEEGRKKYLQSLGVFSMIDEQEKFDNISGIGPTIAVQQNIIRQSNPRSTVGSKTNILKLLALLYTLEGKAVCQGCGSYINFDTACQKCGSVEERLPAGYFMHNTTDGMCLKCSGKGHYYHIDMKKLIQDDSTTLEQMLELIKPTQGYKKLLRKKFKEVLNVPFNQIEDAIKADILYGQYVKNNSFNRSYCVQNILERNYIKNGDDTNGIYRLVECEECGGYRVGQEALDVFIAGKHIGQLAKMNITELEYFLKIHKNNIISSQIGRNLLKDINSKLENLIKSRLGHLSLYRQLSTLSGGELQRLFLNSHLESKMDSLIYILDEPTAGLHESEKAELLKSIIKLKELGNTVIIVEHDKNTIKIADYVIDIGPKAGAEGGEVLYQGSFEGLLKCHESITGKYLSGENEIYNRVFSRETQNNQQKLLVKNANTNNLNNLSFAIPLKSLTAISGVSGSGKSSLITDIVKSCKDDTIVSGIVEVSQEPIGRNSNSNVISYIGVWDKIRKIFADQEDARKNCLTAGHFSFNSKGACQVCGGTGQEKIWMGGSYFISQICKECNGQRYNDKVLLIKYKNKSISDVLEMTIFEAVIFFEDNKNVLSTLRVLESVGMGYIKLGQTTPTLSGGEAQRIKLAKEIGKRQKGDILYILDEPTVGLSPYDINKLVILLDELVKNGNSVIVVEHDIELLSICDWIIELGPKGGEEGGRIIAEGTPTALKQNNNSITGRYLK